MKRIARALIVVLASTSPAAAQGKRAADLSKTSLEDLLNVTITTASLAPEGAAGAPARVQVVTADQVRRRGYRSLMDLLQDLPDFKVDLRGDPDFPSQIVVQGSRGGDRVVVLLDGVRISSPTNEPLPILANYPVHAARQIEVLYGPASALYGADAFSAVINIISRQASDGRALTLTSSVGQFGLYDQTGSFVGRIGGASVLVAGQAQYDRQPDLSRYYTEDFGGLQGQRSGTFNTLFGPMTPPAPVSPDYEAPASAHSFESVVRAGAWQFLAFHSSSRASTTPATTPDNGVYNADVFNRNTLFVGSASYTRRFRGIASMTAATYSRHELDPESGYQNLYSNMKRSYKYAFGSMLKIDEQLSWQPAPSLRLTTGGTVERFFAMPQGADLNAPLAGRDDAPGTILDTNIPDLLVQLRYVNSGVFAQGQYALSPAVTATVGGRIDYNTRYGLTINPRAGLVLHPSPGTTVKLLAGRAYLAPSPYQTHAHYGSFTSTDGGRTYTSPYWRVPNPGLRPQRKSTLEGTVSRELVATLHVSASAFYSRFSDLVVELSPERAGPGTFLGWPVEYIDYAVNEGSGTRYGGTFGVEYVAAFAGDRRFSAAASVALVDGHDVDNDTASNGSLPAGAMAPVEGRLIADIDWGAWSIAPRLAVAGRQRVNATTDTGARRTLPGYARLDVNTRRRLSSALTAFASVENVFDARYRNINERAYLRPEELIGAPQNPRRVTAGVTVSIGGRR